MSMISGPTGGIHEYDDGKISNKFWQCSMTFLSISVSRGERNNKGAHGLRQHRCILL